MNDIYNDAEIQIEIEDFLISIDSFGRSLQLLVKSVVDIVVAVLCLILISPLLLLIAILIKLESQGPIIYKQKRLGKSGRVFQIYKLRSMYDKVQVKLNPDGSTYVNGNDPRITRIGGKLRRFGLDEIPQLLNILLGEMSLVGPRPDQEFHLQYYTKNDYKKLAMKPGITSLAQVSGRNAIPWQKRIEIEIEYVTNFSLVYDIRIIWKTIIVILNGIGLYNSSESSYVETIHSKKNFKKK